MVRTALPLLLAVALSAAGCGSRGERRDASTETGRVNGLTPDEARMVLAKVGNVEITLGDFAARLADQSPYLRARYNSPERRRELLDNLIRFELLAQEGERRGYGRTPEVMRAEEQALIQELVAQEIDARIRPESITDADVRAYFDAHPEEFEQPAQVRASHIRFADRAAAQRVLTQVLAAPDDMELFRRLARESTNDEATRESAGDLRFFSRPVNGQRAPGAPPVPVAEAAFSIETVGGIYPHVVQSEEGFHVVRLTAKRDPLHRSFEEVRRPIASRLFRERRDQAMADLVARLRRTAHVEEDPSVLSDVHIEVPAIATPTEGDE